MRLPIQVEAIVFKKEGSGIEYLLLKRTASRGGFWQPISGGLDNTDQTLQNGVYRELKEETNIHKDEVVRVIDGVHSFEFEGMVEGKKVIQKEEVFGVEVKPDVNIRLGRTEYKEHDEYKWASFEIALDLLKWPENKEALKKLNERLTH